MVEIPPEVAIVLVTIGMTAGGMSTAILRADLVGLLSCTTKAPAKDWAVAARIAKQKQIRFMVEYWNGMVINRYNS